ncbi:hypothetical protein BW45_09615 [Agrobacterium tumefaciens]|nr:hypothetical protein BW45_09615 [Agrobacterium tumefaciens]
MRHSFDSTLTWICSLRCCYAAYIRSDFCGCKAQEQGKGSKKAPETLSLQMHSHQGLRKPKNATLTLCCAVVRRRRHKDFRDAIIMV